jgi:hypothetical protein
MDEARKNKLIDEALGLGQSMSRDPDIIDMDKSIRNYKDIDQARAFVKKYEGISPEDLIKRTILDSSFKNEVSTVLGSLGYSSDIMMTEGVADMFSSFANPTGALLRDMERLSMFGITGAGQQLEEEGLYSGIRGRAIFTAGAEGKGGRFVGVLGEWKRQDIIKEIRSGKSGYVSYLNINNLNEERLNETFDRLGVASVGARADHPDIHKLEARLARVVSDDPAKNYREKLFGEFVSTISDKQRMAMTSELTMPERMFVFDTENIWGTEMMKNLVKNVEDLAGQGSKIDKERIAAYVMSIENKDEKKRFIEQFIQGDRTGVITEAYGVKVDATEMLKGKAKYPTLKRTTSGALDDLTFKRVPGAADQTIDSLYKFLVGIEDVHENGWRLTGANILRHDIPMMGYFGAMLHEYYKARGGEGDDLRAANMLRIGGQFDDLGGIKMKALTFTNKILTGDSGQLAINMLGYNRLFAPTLQKNGAWYVGDLSGEEETLFRTKTAEGMTQKEITDIISDQRARSMALEETGEQGQKLKTILDRHTSYASAAGDIEELFGGGDTLLERQFLEKLDPNINNIEDLFDQYKLDSSRFTGETLQDAFFQRKYNELSELFTSSYVAMDRERMKHRWTVRADKDLILKQMGINSEEFATMTGKAHTSMADALLSIPFLGINVEQFRQTGELAMIPVHMSPEMQYKVNIISQNYMSELAAGRTTEVEALDRINAKVIDPAAQQEGVDFIARQNNRLIRLVNDDRRSSLFENVAEAISGEGTTTEKVVGAWNEAVKATNEAHRAANDTIIPLLMRFNKDMTIAEASNAVAKTMKGQRYALAGIAAIIGVSAVTNKMRSKSTSNEAWDKSPTMDPEEYQRRQRELKYQEEMSQMGNLPLESSNRRNYSYNMRNDRHDHLFRE